MISQSSILSKQPFDRSLYCLWTLPCSDLQVLKLPLVTVVVALADAAHRAADFAPPVDALCLDAVDGTFSSPSR